MLDKKAKEKFHFYSIRDRNYNMQLNITSKEFKELPIELLWGVYLDFAESEGYDVYIRPSGNQWSVYVDSATNKGHHILLDYLFMETRKQAQTEAIKKLNELINE